MKSSENLFFEQWHYGLAFSQYLVRIDPKDLFCNFRYDYCLSPSRDMGRRFFGVELPFLTCEFRIQNRLNELCSIFSQLCSKLFELC